MMLKVALFHVGWALRRLSTYLFFTLYTLLGGLWTLAYLGLVPGMEMSTGTEKLWVNSPYLILQVMTLTSLFGVFTLAATMGRAGAVDAFCRTEALVASQPISKNSYRGGLFLGAFGQVLLVFSGIPLGVWCAVHSGLPPETALGPEVFSSYAVTIAVALLPNLFSTGAFFFALTAITRKMTAVYLGSALLLMGWMMASSMSGESRSSLFALCDPTGMLAADHVVHYWTLAEKNQNVPGLSGLFLWNRLIWVGFGVLSLVVAFRFGNRGFEKSTCSKAVAMPAEPAELPSLPTVKPVLDRWAALAMLARSARFEAIAILKNRYFGAILLCGVLFMAVSAADLGELMGTFTFPVTYQVLEQVGSGFRLFILIMVIFYVGELVHRERDCGMDQIYDALPTPRWLPFVAKFAAMTLMILALLCVIFLTGVALQLARGWTHLNIPLYAVELLLVRFTRFLMIGVLAFAGHVLLNHKQAAHVVVVAFFVASLMAPKFGLDHPLLLFGMAPRVVWSDMNGFGFALLPHVGYKLYWAIFCVFPITLTIAFWVRGRSQGFADRLRAIRFPRQWMLASCAIACVWLGWGMVLFILGKGGSQPQTPRQKLRTKVAFEQMYDAYRNLPSFSVQAADYQVDLFAEQGRVAMAGTYTLVNRHAEPLQQILVHTGPLLKFRQMAPLQDHRREVYDEKQGFFVFRLEQPVASGETVQLAFAYRFQRPRVPISPGPYHLHRNGTFLTGDFFPMPGFPEERLLSKREQREGFGLKPLEGLPEPDAPGAALQSGLGGNTTWARVKARVTCDAEQTAMMPAPLVQTRVDGLRRISYFDSGEDAVLFLPAVLAARYAVAEDHWNQVALRIYHHPDHYQNLGRMMLGLKQSLDYCTAEFGPYPNDFLQIVEFPRYQQFAMSLAGTIPFSESVGFVADVNDGDPRGVDYPFFVTAHEVAHQWWPHQVIPANAKGANFLSESLAQYAALKILEKEIGVANMRPALALQLHAYLKGRTELREAESALVRVEDEDFIYYNKGGLALYTLARRMGEDAVNQTLRRYFAEFAGKQDCFPVAADLVAMFKQAASPGEHALIEDLFEKVTFHDLRLQSANASFNSDGTAQLDIELYAQKYCAEGLGPLTEVTLDDALEFGFYDREGLLIKTQVVKVKHGLQPLTFRVEGDIAKIVVEPFFSVFDRNLEDNQRKVNWEDKGVESPKVDRVRR